MMNQGGNTGTVASLDPTALHNNQSVDARQLYTSAYYPSASGPEVATWAMHMTDNKSTENGLTLNSNYHYAQHTDSYPRVQDESNSASLGSSSLGQPIAPQEYNGYASYPTSTDQYSCGNTNTSTNSGYQSYYQGYQQQSTNPSYSQPTGSYQNSGAPYQPISSFQNTNAGSKDYSRTYYNPGDYQTSGAYPSSGYNNQTTSWSGGNYVNYTSQPCTNNAPDSSGAYSSSTSATTSAQYHQQWADYYGQTEVSCAPGTENMPATSTSNLGRPVSDVTNGYSTSISQPPQSFTPYESPSMQTDAVTSGSHDNYWKHGDPAFQNNHATPRVDYQNHVDANNSYNSSAQQMNSCSQGPNSQYPHGFGAAQQMNSYSQGSNSQYPYGSGTAQQMNSYPEGSNSLYPRGFSTAQQISSGPHGSNSQYQPVPQLPLSYSAALQTVPPADTHSVSKLQIPTNPRIAPNLGLRAPKINKDNFTPIVAVKPAYIGVSIPKPQEKPDAADSLLKPVTFPTSLRGYVERALARCKDDMQVAACQAVMKEVITKATSDGTLNTKDWDTEPLFPVPNTEVADKGSMFTTVIASLSKQKRSPSRKLKTRWEPLPEEKSVDKPTPISHVTYKFNGWFSSNERAKTDSSDSKEEISSSLKFSVEQKSANKKAPMLFKRQRVDDVSNAAENAYASSDSDKEQNLAAYYPAAINLANSAEERKRRENRSKRFDKGQRHRAESNNFKEKNSAAENLYSRRATAMVISKSFEDGAYMVAVEDIDWNALTIKGTCQEIEKRYLRLTSAPDPATVRPEEVLEKALTMVQNSQKNYLYKCDQLKSIRQDLTVQHIRNELTVQVYETHARLAVEVGDVPEYNQCQSQLKSLYAEGVEGSHMEFYAYNLLCVILHSSNYRELLSSMSRLSDETKNDEAVKHALAVRAAVTSGNYVSFFRLYKKAPNLNTCLMDLYVEKIRYEAVKCMSRSYRPTIPVAYIAQVLGFTNVLNTTEGGEEDGVNLEECVVWLKAHGACFIPEANGELQLDTKASTSSLYMPEPDDAVAHGDANLAVNDFLTRTS